MNVIKPFSNVITVTTQNTVSNSSVLFISAVSGSSQVNVYSNSTTQYASFVIPSNTYIFLQKLSTDLISANVAIQATPAAYRG